MIITNYDAYKSLIHAVKMQSGRIVKINRYSTFKSIGLDSMDMLCIICDLEREYDIDIPDGIISIDDTMDKAADSIFVLILNS